MNHQEADSTGTMPLTEDTLATLGSGDRAQETRTYVGQSSKAYEKRVEHTPNARKSQKSKRKSMKKKINSLDPRLPH
ncbi:hypothetical protein Hte_008698 [Hypoxylon texense]